MILSIVFTLPGITACRKYGDGYVKGIVTKYGGNSPAPHIVVYLEKAKKNQKDGNPIQKAVMDSTTTDMNGEYHMPYYKATGYSYSVYAKVRNMYGEPQGLKIVSLDRKIETKNLESDPVAYLKIHQKKISSTPCHLILNFGSYGGTVKFPERSSPIDTILPPLKIVANLKMDVSWIARNADPKVPNIGHTQSINIDENDTLVYEIKYP